MRPQENQCRSASLLGRQPVSYTHLQIELNYEVRLRDADTEFVNELGTMEGVGNVVLVSYNGDYMG